MPVLAKRSGAGYIGRTALMKYMYFLQTIKDVPLGYDFSLYSYGPFDSEVLADLSSAEALKIVDVDTVAFSGGYGYKIQPGSCATASENEASHLLDKHKKDIDWLFSVFGSLNSSELELVSTIVYADRENAEASTRMSIAEVTIRVNEIKPRFSREQIQKFVMDLLQKGVLIATVAGDAPRQ